MDSFPLRYGRDFTVASPGVNDLWLPQYGGEVFAAFDENLVAKDLVRTLTISKGNSLKFPMIHKMGAGRHAAGAYRVGQDVATGQREIFLDNRPLEAVAEFDDVDQIKSHYEVRAEIAKQAGVSLAREMDQNILQLGVNAARTGLDAGNSPFNGGGYKADPTAALDGSAYAVSGSNFATDTAGTLPSSATELWGRNHCLTLLRALEAIAIQWDQRNIPMEDRHCVVPPAAWHGLRNIGLPESKTTTQTIVGYNPFKGGPGGDGVMSPTDANRSGKLLFNGWGIVNSPNLPKDNITTGESKYRGDFRKVRALAIQKQAVGLLMGMGVKVEMGRDIRTGTDVLVNSVLYGGGTLRPECAVSINIS